MLNDLQELVFAYCVHSVPYNNGKYGIPLQICRYRHDISLYEYIMGLAVTDRPITQNVWNDAIGQKSILNLIISLLNEPYNGKKLYIRNFYFIIKKLRNIADGWLPVLIDGVDKSVYIFGNVIYNLIMKCILTCVINNKNRFPAYEPKDNLDESNTRLLIECIRIGILEEDPIEEFIIKKKFIDLVDDFCDAKKVILRKIIQQKLNKN
jgi:hypothetical protein